MSHFSKADVISFIVLLTLRFDLLWSPSAGTIFYPVRLRADLILTFRRAVIGTELFFILL